MTTGPAARRSTRLPRLAITGGDPAGVGPELVARLAASPLAADLIAISDAGLLERAAQRCGITLKLEADDGQPRNLRAAGSLRFVEVPLRAGEVPGQLDPRNAFHVLNTLVQAADGCISGAFDGVVTAPVQKSAINDAGEPFTGHTELFAQRAGCEVVMMLASPELRVALATTHLPLARVPAA
ncbi:MAG TPA: 4-hydroxythreonine-4-phosphate dehydrogenase PdxA, partial [Rhodanobacteraceae bacterium]|nr:4-hydroxythreonine-4-phosphate dehydrogenase PdxA [Rhodanobacteraceae bacterium]